MTIIPNFSPFLGRKLKQNSELINGSKKPAEKIKKQNRKKNKMARLQKQKLQRKQKK